MLDFKYIVDFVLEVVGDEERRVVVKCCLD